jgi:orotidine-5'-phosphate decarboxylase
MTTPIVALDVATLDEARGLVEVLGDGCDFYKVGLELFTSGSGGREAVQWLTRRNARVFLDLKLHDIPNTVRGAARSARDMGASLLTVHGLGGEKMIEAAVAGAGDSCGVLMVTVLTSLDDDHISGILGRRTTAREEVIRLSDVAVAAGARGIVCAGTEAALVRARHPSLGILVPGVRMEGSAAGDQARIVTPAAAASAGATWIVLGRTVTAAGNPREALDRANSELAAAATS